MFDHKSKTSELAPSVSADYYELESLGTTEKQTYIRRFIDSFKPYDLSEFDYDDSLTELEKAALVTANAPLSRTLKARHLNMIAIGGSIGTGLFIGSGQSLAQSGPASLLIGWFLTATMMYTVVQSLGEMAVAFPVSGAFVTYNFLFLDSSWGFSMAWNYALQWLVVLPLELVAASLTIQYWNPHINSVVWVSIFYVLIMVINLFGVKGYGEAEFFFSFLKVVAIVGFAILSIILICGGGPNGEYIGGKYWHHPGAFSHGFKGVCSTFTTAAFSFSGTELIGLASAETENPKKSLPTAIKQVFWRIALFYITSLTLIGFLVPYNSPLLLSSSSVDTSASPFIIAINVAGISALPTIFNIVILVTVLSVANASVYGSSRTLAALGAVENGPKILGYIDREGRPIVGIAVQAVVGLLCFVVASDKQAQVFDWLLALSGLSSIFVWGSICLCHIRFRYALYCQGRGTDELIFVSQVGVWGSYYGLIVNILLLAAIFWVALFPIGTEPNASDFFQSYLAFPIIIVFYLGHKIYFKNWKLYLKVEEIDVDTGRRELDLEILKQEIAEEKLYISQKPFYYKIYRFFC